MMEEFGSDDKKVSKQLHETQKPQLKRPNSVLRDCDTGEAYSDGRMLKKMKESSNYKAIQHLTKHKVLTAYNDEKQDPKRCNKMGSDGRSVKKKFNHCGTKHNESPLSNRVVHMSVRRSAGMLKLPSPSSSSSSLESDVVRDGPRKEAKKRLSITPENYQSEAERIKSFVGWPLNEAVHPEQLARVGFVYTGEGALVQCFQCGVKCRHWYKGDVPLNVHQQCNPHCPFLQTLTSKGQSSSTEQRPPQSYVQPESNDGEHSLQFPYSSDQVTHTRPKPFLQCSGAQQLVHCHLVRQNWEGSDNHEDYMDSPNYSLMASGQTCVPKPERGRTSRMLIQSNHHSHYSSSLEDNSRKCFKSPTQSLSVTLRCSEQFAVEGGLQETESNSPFSNTIYHSANHYNMEGAEQRMRRSDTVVAGIHSATMLRQDPSLSSHPSADLQSDILVHSLDSEQISSGRTAIHSGDGIVVTTIPRTSSSPNLRQNQLPSSSDAILPPSNSNTSPDDGNHEGRISETSYASGWGQSPSLSSQRVSKNITESDDESFYSAESRSTGYSTSTPLDPAKTNIISVIENSFMY